MDPNGVFVSALSWGIPLPGRSNGIALERVINHGVPQRSEKSDDVILPTLPDCVNMDSNQNTNKTDSVPQNNTAKPNRKKRRPRNTNSKYFITYKKSLPW